MTDLKIRPAQAQDADALGEVMFDAIHKGTSKYTEAQRAAWQSTPNSGATWAQRLAQQDVWMAEEAGTALAFLTLRNDGYVDMAFVRGEAQGRGLFRHLYQMLEKSAQDAGHGRLWTHASLMAQPAFLAVGFRVIRHESVARLGETLDRAEMEKALQ
ncbi:GNAT family N-acetyltransferase [Sulfitobacter mediterraneus]|uniref:Acetyltransferase n=1 Tax=Sulfitobacter mediterraneus TaxID=83219 RepID=A0A061SWJ2_9RHOB|nr:GNAT family N-acetyltransferase [Sulfitobacter mediterraneus]KAJ04403.1 acetyltransferase [Sulfitobacter mediterraneus]